MSYTHTTFDIQLFFMHLSLIYPSAFVISIDLVHDMEVTKFIACNIFHGS
jgi:hypothetical protein